MSQLSEIAADLQDNRQRLMHAATARGLRVWGQADVSRLDESWNRLAPTLNTIVTTAQVTAARQSAPYMNNVSAAWGYSAQSARVVPEAFGGVMLDGREVTPAMFGAVTTTKRAIGAGMAPARAFEVGATFLATIMGSAIQDAGRQSDSTLATGKGYTRYLRVVSAGACSRCAILAGKASFSVAFLRHPRCRCTAQPIPDGEASPDGLYDSPQQYFDSMSASEQERVFTKSGAFAVRNGADPVSVVNARRGALSGGGLSGSPRRLVPTTIGRNADGSPLQVFLTNEGTSARGVFGASQRRQSLSSISAGGPTRRSTTTRLMPEQIQQMSGGDSARARELLAKYGYLRL
jgi:hypothetical protein